MPEFILDHGDSDHAKLFQTLDAFTQGYIEAAFFTSTGSGDDADNDLEYATTAEIAPTALAAVVADCARWQQENAALLAQAYATGYEPQRAGNDYWYTRNGHGVGFWDRQELEPDSAEYEALTAEMVANRDNNAAWGAACAKRAALKEQSIGHELSKAAGRHEVNLVRGDDGLIYFE